MRLSKQPQLTGSQSIQGHQHQHLLHLASIDAEPGSQDRGPSAVWIEGVSLAHEAIPHSPRRPWRSGFCSKLLRPTSRAALRESGRASCLPSCSEPPHALALPALHAPSLCDHARDAMDSRWLATRQYGCSVADLYHHERNHQGKANRLLFPARSETGYPAGRNVVCRQRLGGLLKYYQRAA